MKMYGDLNGRERGIIREYKEWKKLDCFHPAFSVNMFEFKLSELMRLHMIARNLGFGHMCK